MSDGTTTAGGTALTRLEALSCILPQQRVDVGANGRYPSWQQLNAARIQSGGGYTGPLKPGNPHLAPRVRRNGANSWPRHLSEAEIRGNTGECRPIADDSSSSL